MPVLFFCHLRPLLHTLHVELEIIQSQNVVRALLPSLCEVQVQGSDASCQFRASPSRCAFERRWRNVGDRVKVATLNWHYFLTSTHSEWKQPVVNGRGGSLAQHKVGTLAFLRPSPRFSRMALCGAVGVLIWPPIKSSLACAEKRLITSYSLTHCVKTLYYRPICSSEMCWMHLHEFTKSFRCCYKKGFGATSVIVKRKRHKTPHFEIPQTDRTLWIV